MRAELVFQFIPLMIFSSCEMMFVPCYSLIRLVRTVELLAVLKRARPLAEEAFQRGMRSKAFFCSVLQFTMSALI